MSAAALSSRELPSFQQRLAYGLLARAPLVQIEGSGGFWVSQAFPGERAYDLSVRAVERRGHCVITACDVPGTTGRMAQITEDGRAFYRLIAGRHAARPALPLTAERIIAEMGEALAVIEREAQRLICAAETMQGEIDTARTAIDCAQRRSSEIVIRLRRLEQARHVIEAQRDAIAGTIAGMVASPARITELRR